MNILITGATRGIGKAIAECVNNGKNKVFATGRNEALLKCYENYCVCDLATRVGIEKLGKYIQENRGFSLHGQACFFIKRIFLYFEKKRDGGCGKGLTSKFFLHRVSEGWYFSMNFVPF